MCINVPEAECDFHRADLHYLQKNFDSGKLPVRNVLMLPKSEPMQVIQFARRCK